MVFLCVRLDAPAAFLFDESSYIPAATNFSAGVNLEPSHPPLGKLILAAGIRLFGDNPWGWRIPSALAGAVILVLIFVLTRQLTGDTPTAVFAALFSAVNGMLFVLARTGTLDAMAIAFLLAGFLCTSAVVRGQLTAWQGGALAGCAFGLCMACKWMALAPMAVCCLALWLARKRAAVGAMVAPFAAAYIAPFLILARFLHAVPSWSWLWAQQVGVFTGHASYNGQRLVASDWWTWPLKVRPQILVYDFGGNGFYVLLLGNPMVMWLGAGAVVVLLYRALRNRDQVAAVVCAAYVVLYGQYIIMPLRTVYYHYYLAAALCLGPALALATRARPRLRVVLAALAVWSFACEYPAMAAVPGGHWTRFF
jgi:dolichyl-phosphate-mannose--protein O-mannosyl transferase